MRRKRVGNGARGHHTTPGRGAHPGRALVACGLLGVRLLPLFVLYPSFCRKTFCYIITRISRGPYIVFSSRFVSSCFLPGTIFRFRASWSSPTTTRTRRPWRTSWTRGSRRRSRAKPMMKWRNTQLHVLALLLQASG